MHISTVGKNMGIILKNNSIFCVIKPIMVFIGSIPLWIGHCHLCAWRVAWNYAYSLFNTYIWITSASKHCTTLRWIHFASVNKWFHAWEIIQILERHTHVSNNHTYCTWRLLCCCSTVQCKMVTLWFFFPMLCTQRKNNLTCRI